MRKNSRRLTALLTALVVLLALAACAAGDAGDAGDAAGDAEVISGTVYVPEYIDLDLGLDYIRSGCADGENVYILGNIYAETEQTDPETGETIESVEPRLALFRVPLDGGEPEELDAFSDLSAGGSDVYSDASDIFAAGDGTLWLRESTETYFFDLPGDFDETTDSKWNYESGSESSGAMVHLDAAGAEIGRIDLTACLDTLEEDGGYIYAAAVDDAGNCFLGLDGRIAVLGPDGGLLFTLEDNGIWGGDLVRLSSGRVGAAVTVTDPGGDDGHAEFREIDTEKQTWGTVYDLPSYIDSPVPGSGEYLFYYQKSDALYGFSAAGTSEKLLTWVSADIDSDNLRSYAVLPDGRVTALTESWSGEHSCELAVLTATDASSLPEKVTLTLACNYLDQDIRRRVLEFNRSSTTHRIEVRDYSEYAADGDYNAGITRLNTEIVAGNVPDILCTDQLPLRQYAAKGLLEDLWTCIDADPDLGRDSLMTHVLECAELDGSLCQVFSSFEVRTVIGGRDTVGDEMGWTLEDMRRTLSAMPEGCAVFGEGDTQSDMLDILLSMNLDSWVDWTTGACDFEGEDFRSVLEFCSSFPAEFDWDSYDYESAEEEPVRIMKGMQLLYACDLSSLADVQIVEAMFGGRDALDDYGETLRLAQGTAASAGGGYALTGMVKDGRYITYIGFPAGGGVGSAFEIHDGLAISSQCRDKDAAWSFVRESLLPKLDEDGERSDGGYSWGFPVNKADFDISMANEMKKTYVTDENGETLLDAAGEPIEESHGTWGWGNSLLIYTRAASQTEYDQFMELYEAIDRLFEYDDRIYDIVSEQAGSYFSGDKSLDETVRLIQGRVELYVNENR